VQARNVSRTWQASDESENIPPASSMACAFARGKLRVAETVARNCRLLRSAARADCVDGHPKYSNNVAGSMQPVEAHEMIYSSFRLIV